jgi:hypothetical protein
LLRDIVEGIKFYWSHLSTLFITIIIHTSVHHHKNNTLISVCYFNSPISLKSQFIYSSVTYDKKKTILINEGGKKNRNFSQEKKI